MVKLPSASLPIIYERPQTWLPMIARFLRTRIAAGAISRWRSLDLSDLYDDESEWLSMLQRELKSDMEAVTEELTTLLQTKSVRALHACRPKSLADYLRDGIRPYRRSSYHRALEEILADPRLVEQRGGILCRANELRERENDKFVYLALDGRNILEFAGHYLIYGSELLCATLGSEFRHVLTDRGIPTLLEVDLALSSISTSDCRELAPLLLREWVRLIAKRSTSVLSVDFTFIVRDNVPPEAIVGHSHPKVILDPLEGGRVLKNRNLFCCLCCPET